MTTLTRNQTKSFVHAYTENGEAYTITATARHDDECGNGHNTFSITAEIMRGRRWESGGCLREEIAKHFPHLEPLIKWHLCSTDGPMHYVANTVFHASDRDHNGLLEGETRQIRNGKTGQLAWKLEATEELPKYLDADEQPTATATLRYVPWCTEGKGKPRDLDAARSCAIWPEATDEELMADDLADRLRERLPALLVEFQAAVESLGFTY
jgi:hypothetical protein